METLRDPSKPERNGITACDLLAKRGRLVDLLHFLHGVFGLFSRLARLRVHRTHDSWSRARRAVAKAEHLAKGSNPRFVVTSLGAERWEARRLYEDLYRARPQPLNRTFRKRPAWSHATSRERDRRSFCVSISLNATQYQR